VVVVPKAEIADIAIAYKQREEKEARFRRELLQGKTTWDMLNLGELMRKKGIALDI